MHVPLVAAVIAATLCFAAVDGAAIAAAAEDTGTIRVTTAIEGRPSADFTLRLRVRCRTGGEQTFDRVLVFDEVRTRTIKGLDAPTRCSVTQPDDLGSGLMLYEVDGGAAPGRPRFDVVPEDQVDVSATASFPSSAAIGTIEVTKEVVGQPEPGTTYVVEVRCGRGTVQVVTFGATGGTEVAFVDVTAQPRVCTIRETRRGGADRTTTKPRSGKVTVDVDHPTADVTVTNSYG